MSSQCFLLAETMHWIDYDVRKSKVKSKHAVGKLDECKSSGLPLFNLLPVNCFGSSQHAHTCKKTRCNCQTGDLSNLATRMSRAEVQPSAFSLHQSLASSRLHITYNKNLLTQVFHSSFLQADYVLSVLEGSPGGGGRGVDQSALANLRLRKRFAELTGTPLKHCPPSKGGRGST
jgi:hypothetical protein